MTFAERRRRVTDTAGVLLFLEIDSPRFTGPLRAVNDTQNWTLAGDEYVGVPFRFKLPDDVSGQPARSSLEISNVGTGMTDELERLLPGEVVWGTFRIADRAEPSVVAHTLRIPMTNVSVNQGVVTANFGVDAMTRQQAVRIRFTPFLTPGMFGQ